MNYLHSALDTIRDKYAYSLRHTSTFRSTGQITPEEFLLAGDFLVYKFPSWSWADASVPSKRVSYLPAGKQFLVTRGVPCHRRLDANFAGEAGQEEMVVGDGFEGAGEPGGEDEGWLRTGGMDRSMEQRIGDVRTVDERGMEESAESEEEIPDMEDDDDEAIIRDGGETSGNAPLRTYTLYITYTPYYRTPRLYLSGYLSASEPLPPHLMMEDIVGDYKDKTVTLEDFPFFDAGLKMASVHPCRHASVMKTLLDRADAALKLRKQRMKDGKGDGKVESGMEGLVDQLAKTNISEDKKEGDEWEVLQHGPEGEEDEIAIRVDQYLVVFLKFMASVTPGIEHDFTMGV